MDYEFAPTRLDVKALAQSGSEIAGRDQLSRYARLCADMPGQAPDGTINWTARGEWRANAAGQDEVWLKLRIDAALPLVCQRCLGPVDVPMAIDRWFRFVASEDIAQAQDDEAEEDLLVLGREFNLAELIEDELLMDWPAVPRHETCPIAVKMEAADPDFEASAEVKTNPFAVLAKLQGGKSS
jgi:uncharacterized protein